MYIYSTSLDEIILGRIEGFSEENRSRVKVLQQVSDGIIRHVVSWVYVFRTESEALSAKEFSKRYAEDNEEMPLRSGMVVYLLQNGEIIRDDEGDPYNYQIIAVHQKENKVSLVTPYGEMIGKYDWKDVRHCSNNPLFRKSDYEIGQLVSWIEGDHVYEGIIIRLKESQAEVTNIKQLLPIDVKKFVPYYKIPRESLEDQAPQILTTLIGDSLED